MKKRILACLLALVMLVGLLPATVLAEDVAGPKVYVDATKGDDSTGNGTEGSPYKTVGKALENIGDNATVYLADGNYSTYAADKSEQAKYCAGKTVTFVGTGAKSVNWQIGAKVPDPTLAGTEYNGDYSFDGAKSVTFKNLTLMSAEENYLGFIRINNTIVEDCTIIGRTFYWGYETSLFKNVIFNGPKTGYYPIWTYTGHETTFKGCTFNVTDGRVVNVPASVDGPQNLTVNFEDCTVNSDKPSKSVLNIHDNAAQNKFVRTIKFSGKNTVNGLKPNGNTCSRLFEVELLNPDNVESVNNGVYTTVFIDDEKVWTNGKMVAHAIDTANDKYTDGYKDDAFTVTTELAAKGDGSYERTVKKVCNYCGYTEIVKEVKKDDIVDIIPVILPAISKNETAPKLNTRDHFAYVQGYPDGTVKPAGSITRAEVAAILFRLMDADSRSLYYSTASGFRDVDSTKWYNTYVATLNNAGVITDSRTGYFRPNDAITRAELAAMLAQFAEKKSAAIYFSDVSAGYWAANAIALTANLGWINGYPDGTFGPDKTVTRAELMAMVNRATGRAPESTSALLSGMKTWKDNADTARWYYLDVQEATNSHTYTGAPTETWTSLTATPDWSQYE